MRRMLALQRALPTGCHTRMLALRSRVRALHARWPVQSHKYHGATSCVMRVNGCSGHCLSPGSNLNAPKHGQICFPHTAHALANAQHAVGPVLQPGPQIAKVDPQLVVHRYRDMSGDEVMAQRYAKFRKLGHFSEFDFAEGAWQERRPFRLPKVRCGSAACKVTSATC